MLTYPLTPLTSPETLKVPSLSAFSWSPFPHTLPSYPWLFPVPTPCSCFSMPDYWRTAQLLSYWLCSSSSTWASRSKIHLPVFSQYHSLLIYRKICIFSLKLDRKEIERWSSQKRISRGPGNKSSLWSIRNRTWRSISDRRYEIDMKVQCLRQIQVRLGIIFLKWMLNLES